MEIQPEDGNHPDHATMVQRRSTFMAKLGDKTGAAAQTSVQASVGVSSSTGSEAQQLEITNLKGKVNSLSEEIENLRRELASTKERLEETEIQLTESRQENTEISYRLNEVITESQRLKEQLNPQVEASLTEDY